MGARESRYGPGAGITGAGPVTKTGVTGGYTAAHGWRDFLITMQILTLITWFALEVSLTSYTGGAALGTQTLMITAYTPTFYFRSAATIGGILLMYYADRHPLNRAINFGSFTANTLILFSWLADGGLYLAYQGWSTQTATIGSTACATGKNWCMINDGLATMSILNFCFQFLIMFYTIYQLARSEMGYSIAPLEGWAHTLVWLEIIGFIIWTCAAISLTSRPDVVAFNSETLGFWAERILLGIAIFAITAAGIASFADRTVGWASASVALQFLTFITFLPALIWMSQITFNGGTSSRCPVSSGWACAAKMCVAAGIGIIDGCAFFAMFSLWPFVGAAGYSRAAGAGYAAKTEPGYTTTAAEEPAYGTATPATGYTPTAGATPAYQPGMAV